MTTGEPLQPMDAGPAPSDGAPRNVEAAGVAGGGAAEAPPPPPPASASATPPAPTIADWPAPPAEPPGSAPRPGSTIGLWPAGTSAVVSFLLGFPAGLAITAASWYRLGRRGLAIGHLAVLVLLTLLVTVTPAQLGWLAAIINLVVAVYVYAIQARARHDAVRSGIVVAKGGLGAGIAIMLGGWALVFLTGAVLGLVLVATGWAGEVTSTVNGTGASPVPVARTIEPAATPMGAGPARSGSASTPAGAAGTFANPDLDACPTRSTEGHQAPDLEALVPRRVGGRDLVTWSLSGWCWVHLAAGDDGVAALAPLAEEEGVDVASLKYAVTGRADVHADPPYFVFAASRPADPETHDLALALLLGGAGYDDWPIDMSAFEPREIDGRMAFAGTPDMVTQSEHQRGRPWLYQTADTMFVILTAEDAWAEEAIGQLPCCWSN